MTKAAVKTNKGINIIPDKDVPKEKVKQKTKRNVKNDLINTLKKVLFSLKTIKLLRYVLKKLVTVSFFP